MTTHTPLFLLAALGVLSAGGTAAAAVDTSQWTCESCPYPKGTSGTVAAGLGVVSDESAHFGDFTGLQRKGAHLVLGGTMMHNGEGGYFAKLSASDLGLDTRSLSAQAGREGIYALSLSHSELPRYFARGLTPFSGNGGAVLTLPAGFASATTAAMPLASTLQDAEPGYKWQRTDLGASLIGGSNWTVRVKLRRDVRDGTRPMSASMFSTAAQVLAPVDHVTSQLEVAALYTSAAFQATLAYQISQFSNGAESLTWDNPFLTVVPGSTRGRLALAPDNQFHQIVGSAGYTVTPTIRASADFAIGRMTQNEAYLASTVTPGVAARTPVLPGPSLDGRVDTYSGSVKLSAAPIEGLRLTALFAHDLRDNVSAINSYPQVATDMFLSAERRSNTPFRFVQNRLKLGADWRGPGTLRVAGGADQDNRQRRYHEVVDTRETTVWARVGVQPIDELSLSLKLAHAERTPSAYGVTTWFGAPENPLLRKFQLADRRRDTSGVRADMNLSEKLSVGLSAEYANDDFRRSLIGLKAARSFNFGLDLAYAYSEHTRLTAFGQTERIRSLQDGSQTGIAPDWSATSKDRFEVLGIGVKHAAIPGKLDLGADLNFSRSRSSIGVETGIGNGPFPADKTALDSVKLYADYKISDKLSVMGSWWRQSYETSDWRLDGVAPATVGDFLALGQQAPNYSVDVLRVVMRYRF